MAKKKQSALTDWEQIEIGDQVKHPKWGVGTVLYRSGMGETAKAIVVFPEEGQKKLMLRYAKLVKVGSTSLKSVEKLKAEVAASEKKPRRAAAKAKKVEKPKAEPVEEEQEEVEVDLEIADDKIVIEDSDEVVGFDDDDNEVPIPKKKKDPEE